MHFRFPSALLRQCPPPPPPGPQPGELASAGRAASRAESPGLTLAACLLVPAGPRGSGGGRHGGADGSGEPHRDGLSQGTRVREPPPRGPWWGAAGLARPGPTVTMAGGRYSPCFCPQGEGSGPHREPGHRGCDGLVSDRPPWRRFGGRCEGRPPG